MWNSLFVHVFNYTVHDFATSKALVVSQISHWPVTWLHKAIPPKTAQRNTCNGVCQCQKNKGTIVLMLHLGHMHQCMSTFCGSAGCCPQQQIGCFIGQCLISTWEAMHMQCNAKKTDPGPHFDACVAWSTLEVKQTRTCPHSHCRHQATCASKCWLHALRQCSLEHRHLWAMCFSHVF